MPYHESDHVANMAYNILAGGTCLQDIELLRNNDAWFNAVAESFFHTLKTQLIHHVRFKTFEEAERILFKYIEMYYNQRRKHSANGWKMPAHREQVWYNRKNVA